MRFAFAIVCANTSRAWRRLEAAGAPAAIDEQSRDRRLSDIGEHPDVTSTTPAQERIMRSRRTAGKVRRSLPALVGYVQASGLRIGYIGVGAGADHEFALVRFDIRRGWCWTSRRRASSASPARTPAPEGIASSGMRTQPSPSPTCGPRRRRRLPRRDRPARRLDARDRAGSVAADCRHFAVLDDVDSARRRCPRVAPGDRVVPRCAAAPLQRRADDRIADVARDVEDRAEGLGLFRRQPFVVDARQAIGVDMALSPCTSCVLCASISTPRGEYMTL